MSVQLKAIKTKDLRSAILEMEGPLSRAHNLTIALALASVSDASYGEECRRDALQELGIMARDATAQCKALWQELFEILRRDHAWPTEIARFENQN